LIGVDEFTNNIPYHTTTANKHTIFFVKVQSKVEMLIWKFIILTGGQGAYPPFALLEINSCFRVVTADRTKDGYKFSCFIIQVK